MTEAETEEFTRSRAGRPSLSGRRSPSTVLGVRLHPDLRSRVEQVATDSGVSVSDVVRDALTAWVARKRRSSARR